MYLECNLYFLASPVPNYARNTVSSCVRHEGVDNKLHTPLPNIGDSFSDHIYSDSDLSASMDNLAQAKVTKMLLFVRHPHVHVNPPPSAVYVKNISEYLLPFYCIHFIQKLEKSSVGLFHFKS